MSRVTRISSVLCGVLLAWHGVFAAQGKVLIIDSYHEGYAWSDAVVGGAQSVLSGGAEVKVVRMDTKRNTAEAFKVSAGERVKEEIDAWKPNVVIACDDNASKYVIVPHFKNSKTPFVFCGVNWDASLYGFPCDNVTGITEVSLVPQLVDLMSKYAKGKRIAFLGKDNVTDHKEASYITKLFSLRMQEKYVNTFEEWKKAYKELQSSADMLMVVNNAGISGWNDAEAKSFVLENTKIPSGTCHDHIAPFVLISYAKAGAEQGEWAAGTAIQILEGKSPQDIPVAKNRKGDVYVNLPLARTMGITFPLDIMKAAKIIKE